MSLECLSNTRKLCPVIHPDNAFARRFLEEQVKEAVARAEGAERDVVRNENIVVSTKADIDLWREKQSEVDKEIDKIDDLVEGLGKLEEDPQPDVEEKPEAEEDEEE